MGVVIKMADMINTCCFTGHRVIQSGDRQRIEANLDIILDDLYKSGVRNFIFGGALGFDLLAAQRVLKLKQRYYGVRLIAALPCKNQDAKWNSYQKKIYSDIVSRADEKIYVSEYYTSDCMHKRNRYMVDNSSIVVAYIVYPGGGTAYTVNYAYDCGKRIINVLTME